MKNTVLAILAAGTLALSASGSALAAGKMGGISGGIDAFTSVCPALTAGKMGGVTGGIDRLSTSSSVESEGDNFGVGMDRCGQPMPSGGSV